MNEMMPVDCAMPLAAEAARYREALCEIISMVQGNRHRGLVNKIEDVALAAFKTEPLFQISERASA